MPTELPVAVPLAGVHPTALCAGVFFFGFLLGFTRSLHAYLECVCLMSTVICQCFRVGSHILVCGLRVLSQHGAVSAVLACTCLPCRLAVPACGKKAVPYMRWNQALSCTVLVLMQMLLAHLLRVSWPVYVCMWCHVACSGVSKSEQYEAAQLRPSVRRAANRVLERPGHLHGIITHPVLLKTYA